MLSPTSRRRRIGARIARTGGVLREAGLVQVAAVRVAVAHSPQQHPSRCARSWLLPSAGRPRGPATSRERERRVPNPPTSGVTDQSRSSTSLPQMTWKTRMSRHISARPMCLFDRLPRRSTIRSPHPHPTAAVTYHEDNRQGPGRGRRSRLRPPWRSRRLGRRPDAPAKQRQAVRSITHTRSRG